MNKTSNFLKAFEDDFYDYTKINNDFFDKYSQVGVAGKEWRNLGFDNLNANDSYYYYMTSPLYFLGMIRLQMKRKDRRFSNYKKWLSGTVLDFGAGAGGEAFYFSSLGKKITYYEPNAIARDFMAYRSAKHNVKIDIMHPWEFYENDKKFDNILCFDVFDHVPNWREMIPVFKKKLKTNGKLIHQTKFGHKQEDCPYHFADSDSDINKEFKKHGINIVQLESVK